MRAVRRVATAWVATSLATSLVTGLLTGLLSGMAGTASATPVTIAFAGTVSQLPTVDPADALGAVITTGTPFSGHYTFDPLATDAAAGAQTGAYAAAGAPFGLDLVFGGPGGFSLVFSGIAIGIGNDLAGADFYTAITPLLAPDPGLTASLVLIDSAGRAFGSDALPDGAPVAGDFETRQLLLTGSHLTADGVAAQVEILGSIDTVACAAGCRVPEPGSLLLAATALAALLPRRQAPPRAALQPLASEACP